MECEEIMDILHSLDAGSMASAGSDYASLGQTLATIADNLQKHATTLSDDWKGGGATAAVNSLQQLHAYTSQLSTQASQTGQAMSWLGSVMHTYQNMDTPNAAVTLQSAAQSFTEAPGATGPGTMTANSPGTPYSSSEIAGAHAAAREANNKAAQSYLKTLSSHIVTANSRIPAIIVGTPPKSTARGTASQWSGSSTSGAGSSGSGATSSGVLPPTAAGTQAPGYLEDLP
jgi:uncharacterized protein YukE